MNHNKNLDNLLADKKETPFDYIQKIATFPEYNWAFVRAEMPFEERLESVEPIQKVVLEARTYFYEKEREAFKNPIKLSELNPWFIYVLQQCVQFGENKKKINDLIWPNINDDVYHQRTGRYWYHSTMWLSKNLAMRFLSPRLFERRKESIIGRDTLEQAARICDYVLKHFNGYKKDHVDRRNEFTEDTASELSNNFK